MLEISGIRAGYGSMAVLHGIDLRVDAGEIEDPVLRAGGEALRAGDAAALGRALHNDLQHAALELAPSLAEPLAVAEDAGALGVLVSGSGPTVAALARSKQHALVIAAAITAAGVADDVATAVGPVPGARIVVTGPHGHGEESLHRTV